MGLRQKKPQKNFLKKFNSAKNEPTPNQPLNMAPYLNALQTLSDFTQNRKIVGSQSKSSTKNPKLRQLIRIEYHFTEKHPIGLG